mmetsp:Transcript_3618/g.3057  ORF Transcript_3618/g.3057 Transcript_3618/m.3057 type:complete len:144 (+) Transcript_3618:200-631(+)
MVNKIDFYKQKNNGKIKERTTDFELIMKENYKPDNIENVNEKMFLNMFTNELNQYSHKHLNKSKLTQLYFFNKFGPNGKKLGSKKRISRNRLIKTKKTSTFINKDSPIKSMPINGTVSQPIISKLKIPIFESRKVSNIESNKE